MYVVPGRLCTRTRVNVHNRAGSDSVSTPADPAGGDPRGDFPVRLQPIFLVIIHQGVGSLSLSRSLARSRALSLGDALRSVF